MQSALALGCAWTEASIAPPDSAALVQGSACMPGPQLHACSAHAWLTATGCVMQAEVDRQLAERQWQKGVATHLKLQDEMAMAERAASECRQKMEVHPLTCKADCSACWSVLVMCGWLPSAPCARCMTMLDAESHLLAACRR